MKFFLMLLASVSAFYFGVKAAAGDNEKDSIYWGRPDIKPMYFVNDESTERLGVGDLILNDIASLLPGYRHLSMQTNWRRLMAEIRAGNQVCGMLYRTPSREEYMVFSNEVMLPAAVRLFIRNGEARRFGLAGELGGQSVSLAKVLADNKGLRMGHAPGHSYGHAVDVILERNRENIHLTHGHTGHVSMVKLLLSGRIDAFIEFPWVMKYHLRALGAEYSDLLSFRLSEMPYFEPVYVACPKNTWGKRLVNQLNAISPPLHIRMKHHFESWLDPEELKQYRENFDRYSR